jgi:hypothetical protein
MLDAFFGFGSSHLSEGLINLTINSHIACVSGYVRGKDLRATSPETLSDLNKRRALDQSCQYILWDWPSRFDGRCSGVPTRPNPCQALNPALLPFSQHFMSCERYGLPIRQADRTAIVEPGTPRFAQLADPSACPKTPRRTLPNPPPAELPAARRSPSWSNNPPPSAVGSL